MLGRPLSVRWWAEMLNGVKRSVRLEAVKTVEFFSHRSHSGQLD